MSWNIAFIGKPENLVVALQNHSTTIDGQSKEEYDAALPHLVALVKENFGTNPPLMRVAANGHGVKESNRTCSVVIESVYGTVV